MDKTFDAGAAESRWAAYWEQHGCYRPAGNGQPYSIMIPPPNVTGTLHMGHAFQHTVMDALIRYHRMRGFDTLWQPGTDHAGIATQMVVERNLKLAGEPSRAELGRDAFLTKVWEWKKYSGGTIESQIRRLGSSVDWDRNAFTMDPAYSRAVSEHFVTLHENGLIYRGKRLVNWDPVLQTAISDLEVVSEEENGKLWHFRYPLAPGATYVDDQGQTKDYLVVATTRPETMLGDTAVAVHPEDPRYQSLIGQYLVLPLCNRPIPVVADDYVDRDFGTGCVKITPAHDFNDYALGQRHRLPILNVLDRQACILTAEAAERALQEHWLAFPQNREREPIMFGNRRSPLIPPAYQGLDRFVARKKIVIDLEGLGLLDKIDDHKLKVPRGDRSGAVVEPYLTDQWFVDLTRKRLDDGRDGGWTAITKPALDAFKDGKIKFVPENWINTYNQWLDNIQDWCISRQLWWGHRIPAWYNAQGEVFVGRSPYDAFVQALGQQGEFLLLDRLKIATTDSTEHINRKLREADSDRFCLIQDEDVFDTWFSSDIWPMATLGWPEKTEELKKWYPSSVLVTGFDIIFFWVARMVMMGRYFMNGDVPFREVYITGLVRDPEGNKMSKSKGNVLDPLDVVDGISLENLTKKRTTGLMNPATAPKIAAKTQKDYPKGIEPVGVDALRFTFAALATQGRDIRFDAARAAGYRNFCNKIWNAARYVLISCEDQDTGLDPNLPMEFSVADRWIVSRLQRLEAEVADQFASYRFDLLSSALYQFVWNEYCDWYLELSKPALLNGSDAAKRGARRTLLLVLESWLRLLHPVMPFITEEIWQRVKPLTGIQGNSIMSRPYPQAQNEKMDQGAEADIEWLKALILGVRQIRGEMDIAPGKILPLLIQDSSADDQSRLLTLGGSIEFLARVETPRVLTPDNEVPQSATALLGNMKLLVPMAGLIDKQAELSRLTRRISALEQDLAKTQARVENPNFAKAPEAVQQLARDLLAKQLQDRDALRVQCSQIAAL